MLTLVNQRILYVNAKSTHQNETVERGMKRARGLLTYHAFFS